MGAELDAASFSDLRIPLLNNWRACEIHTAADARTGLFEQIPNSVRWAETIERLAANGITRFVEVGPGAVLTGLLRNIGPALTGIRFGEAADWEKLNAALA